MRRFTGASRVLLVLAIPLMLATAACVPGEFDLTGDSLDSAPPTASSETSAPSKLEETHIALGQFGSRGDTWRDALVSVMVRGDVLLVRVSRDVSDAEIDDIKSAGRFIRDMYALEIEDIYIIYDEADSLLSYGPVE